MDRKEYTTDNFIKDEFFQRWVFSPDPESDVYWYNFRNEFPEKQQHMEEARIFLETFEVNNVDILESRIINLKRKIDASIDGIPLSGEGFSHFSPDLKAVQDTSTIQKKNMISKWIIIACGILLFLTFMFLIATHFG
ncbi:MAG TPA: hypothetical protein VD884_14140 [Ohtaekwangia sp.]|nr:hypothetical protein [Ohtaekwangia sp.]